MTTNTIRGYRVHAADESLETLLDPARPDGWVASDETYEAQPHGISACETIHKLGMYLIGFSMNVRPDDRIVRLGGNRGDQARDEKEIRIVVDEYEVIGTGRELLDAMDVVKEYRSCREWDEAVEEAEVEDSPTMRQWAAEIWEGE